jgi:hypothetical protein
VRYGLEVAGEKEASTTAYQRTDSNRRPPRGQGAGDHTCAQGPPRCPNWNWLSRIVASGSAEYTRNREREIHICSSHLGLIKTDRQCEKASELGQRAEPGALQCKKRRSSRASTAVTRATSAEWKGPHFHMRIRNRKYARVLGKSTLFSAS